MNRFLNNMAYEVQKGYSPDNLYEWQKNEHKISCIGLVFVIGAYLPLITCSLLGITEKDGMMFYPSFILAIVLLLAGGIFIVNNINHRQFRDKVCNALAGLELGVYHCADDLVINLCLDWDSANAIIDGQYDDWLRHRSTCRFMPN